MTGGDTATDSEVPAAEAPTLTSHFLNISGAGSGEGQLPKRELRFNSASGFPKPEWQAEKRSPVLSGSPLPSVASG